MKTLIFKNILFFKKKTIKTIFVCCGMTSHKLLRRMLTRRIAQLRKSANTAHETKKTKQLQTFEKRWQMNHTAVANHIGAARRQHARRQQMDVVRLAINLDRVA